MSCQQQSHGKVRSNCAKYWVETLVNQSTHDIHLQLHVVDGTTFGTSVAESNSDNGLVFDSRVAMQEMRESESE